MTYTCKDYEGLQIVFKPSKLYKNEFDQINKTDGIRAKFFQGHFITTDKDIIKRMDLYMKQHKDLGITKIDEKKKAFIDKAAAKAKEKAEKDYQESLKDAEKKYREAEEKKKSKAEKK